MTGKTSGVLGMDRAGKLYQAVVAGAVMLGLFGCATVPPQRVEKEEYVWPLPPDPPKIKHVGSLHSEMDVGRQRSFAGVLSEALFGRQVALVALRKPYGVYADGNGRVYVADTGWGKVLAFDASARTISLLGEAGKGTLTRPGGVAAGSAGRIYVTDSGSRRVIVYDRNGEFLTAFGGKETLVRPSGIALNEKLGRVYVVDTWDHQVKAFDLAGQLLFKIGKVGEKPAEDRVGEALGERIDYYWNRGDGDGEFRFPSHAALDRDGRLYVADTLNSRIQIFDPEGKFLKKFGRFGDNPGEFARPKGIALDSEGHIYVTDAAFNNVQIFDQEGRLLLAFGKFGYGKGDLRLPAGIHIDASDRIYVVDQYNHRVQVYQYLGGKTEEQKEGGEKR